MEIPNILTILRIILVPMFIIFIWYNLSVYALITFIVAGLTDALDGYIARKFKQETQLGKILDPIADKALLISAFIFLFNSKLQIKLPFWFVVIVISRDIYILAGSFLIYILKGYLKVKPSTFGKATTFFQIILIIYVLVSNIDISLYNERLFYTILSFNILFLALSTLTYTYDGLTQLNNKENF